jgi:hypothetical protein
MVTQAELPHRLVLRHRAMRERRQMLALRRSRRRAVRRWDLMTRIIAAPPTIGAPKPELFPCRFSPKRRAATIRSSSPSLPAR